MKKHIIIIGTGFAGINAAKLALDADYEVLILEKKNSIGGVWRDFANTSSRVQIIEPVYHFDVPGKDSNQHLTDFTPRNEILENAQEFFHYYELDKRTIFNAEATLVKKYSETKVRVQYKSGNAHINLLCDGVMLFPGGLSKPHVVHFPDESKFRGKIALGISDDVSSVEYKDKEVVILGQGAFAVENARTALEYGAKKVTILCKSYNLVLSKYASFFIEFGLIQHINTWSNVMTSLPRLIGHCQFLSKMLDKKTVIQKTIYPFSDIFYLALHYKIFNMVQDEVEYFSEDGVVTKEGREFKADIVLKCFGFSHQHHMENILNFNYLQGFYINGNPRILYFTEGGLGFRKLSSFSTGSYLSLVKSATDVFLYFLQHTQEHEKFKKKFQSHYNLIFSLSATEKLFRTCIKYQSILRYHLLYRRIRSRQAVLARYSEEEFIASNRQDWYKWCHQLAKQSKIKTILAYPYKPTMTKTRNFINNLISKLITYKFNRVSIYKSFNTKPSSTVDQPIEEIAEIKDHMLSINGASLYVNERGQGLPIICIHGLPQTSYAWTKTADALAKNHRVFTYDLRGLGSSCPCQKGLDIENLSADLKGILDHFQLKSAIIMGTGLGGCIAQQFALDHPDRVSACILLSTSPITDPKPFRAPKSQLLSRYPLLLEIPYADYLFYSQIKKLINNSPFSQDPDVNSAYKEEYLSHLFKMERCQALLEYYRSIKQDKIIEIKDHISCSIPTLWLRGSEDPYLPTLKENVLTHFSHQEVVTLEGYSHWLAEECPHLIVDLTNKFLLAILRKAA